MNCPMCGEIAIAATIVIGVGYEQCEPFHCFNCGWVEPNSCRTEKCHFNKCKSYAFCKGKAFPKIEVPVVVQINAGEDVFK